MDDADTLRAGVIEVAVVRLGIAPEDVVADQVAYTSVAEACFGGCAVSSVPMTITA